MSDADFARYLDSLIASWEGLAAPRPAANVVHGADYVAAHFDYPVLNNAVILAPAGIEPAARTYAAEPYALWCRDDDRHIAQSLADHGYQLSETTRPMVCSLDELAELDEVDEMGGTVVIDADLERFAEFVEVPFDLLRDVPDLRAYATEGYDSGLVLQDVGTDVYVSMVYTLPTARRRGLAVATLTAALRDARRRGTRSASLQSTPMAENLYLRYGFRPVGRWQEWVHGDQA
jgi:GNAT superfamily N-acetyltransferase